MYYQLRLLVCEGDTAKLWYMVFDHPLQLITFAFGRVPDTNYFVSLNPFADHECM